MRARTRLWIVFACLLVVAAIFMGTAGAAATDSNAQRLKEADTLFSLKLFQGTDQGYELDKPFTRAQGAVMILRLFGWEKAAAEQAGSGKSPFKDMPAEHWASAYVAFAYSKDLVHGVSNTDYAPDQPMNGAQFATLVLRALGYTEAEPEQAAQLAVTSELLASGDSTKLTGEATFVRGDMLEVAYHAVTAKLKGGGKTLLQKLVEDDQAVDAAAAAASGLYTASAKASDDPLDKIENAIQDALKQ